MTLVAILTIRPRAIGIFRRYEYRAAMIMAKYGGKIERSVVISPDAADESLKEIHIVTFPDEGAYDSYRRDEELRDIAYMREGSVIATEIMIGEDGPDYGSPEEKKYPAE